MLRLKGNQAYWVLGVPQGENLRSLKRNKRTDLALGYTEQWKNVQGSNGGVAVRKDIPLKGLSSGNCFILPRGRTEI
jgi:hypothetical protein